MPGIDIETEGSWDEAIINDHGVCISANVIVSAHLVELAKKGGFYILSLCSEAG